jgi:hypothetical protein
MTTLQRLLVAGVSLVGLALLLGFFRQHPEHLPWTPLALAQPVGAFTGAKLQALAETPPRCRALLSAAGADAAPATPAGCSPPDPATACSLAAAMFLSQRDVVQPAAQRHFGQPLAGLAVRAGCPVGAGPGAVGIDITGFRLADGRVISVARGWHGAPAEAAFLRDVRDGACRLFATTRSPDFDSRSAGRLHVDAAAHPRRHCD